MVEFLLQNGADIAIKTKEEEQTPVHFAAKNDAINSLHMLLGYGADIDARDSKNRTPLQVGTISNNTYKKRVSGYSKQVIILVGAYIVSYLMLTVFLKRQHKTDMTRCERRAWPLHTHDIFWLASINNYTKIWFNINAKQEININFINSFAFQKLQSDGRDI